MVLRLDDGELSPKLAAMSPLTMPRRLSIFSLGGGRSSGSASLRRMATAKVSKSTDELSSLDSPSVLIDAPSTPVALTRGLRSSLFNLFRPTFGGGRRPSYPVIDGRSSILQPATPGPDSGPPLVAARGRRPSDCDCSSDLCRSTDDDDEEDKRASGSGRCALARNGKVRSVGDRLETAAPPALPRRPPHLFDLPSTPMCSDRPLPLLPPSSMRRTSPLHIRAVSRVFTCYFASRVAALLLLTRRRNRAVQLTKNQRTETEIKYKECSIYGGLALLREKKKHYYYNYHHHHYYCYLCCCYCVCCCCCYILQWVTRFYKKGQLSLTNPRDACEKFARFT